MKKAYLTIDDAPTKDFIQKVDFLVENNVPAVFFCRGDHLVKRKKEVVYAIKKGFIIGNHAWDHPHFSDLTFEQIKNQITKTDALIEEIYTMSGVERPAKLFRFPYGDKGKHHAETQEFLREQGYVLPRLAGITYEYYGRWKTDHDVMWTYDVVEYVVGREDIQGMEGITDFESVLARMEKDDPEEMLGLNYEDSEDIILLHDHDYTTELFEPIINKLLEKVTFKELRL